MSYPNQGDYDRSVQNLKTMVKDPLLSDGSANKMQMGMLEAYSGGFSRVYPITTKSGKYALRCWTGEIGDSEQRYERISAYINPLSSSYFVPFVYIKEGIMVNGQAWPILRMDWTEGIDLKEYVGLHCGNKDRMDALAANFLEMTQFFHQHEMSHGDLQNENIRVKPDGSLVLVDYDSLFVPGLEGWEETVKGYPAYQHPKRDANVYTNAKVDYFSELIIYLSIKLLRYQPSLWEDYQLEGEERQFFFAPEDYLDLTNAPRWKAVQGLSSETDQLLEVLRQFCEAKDIQELTPLDEVLLGMRPEIELFEIEKIGDDTFLSWAVKNADVIEVDGQPQIMESGKFKITGLTATKTFTIVASKAGNSEPEIAHLEVKVPRISVFTSDEYHVYDGKKITLFWEVHDANKITVKPLGDRSHQAIGQEDIIAQAQQEYVLEAVGDTRTVSKKLPLHFIKIPSIKLGPIAQPNITKLSVEFNNPLPALNLALPTQAYFQGLKTASTARQNQWASIKSPAINTPLIAGANSSSTKKEHYSNLKKMIISAKAKISQGINKQLLSTSNKNS